MIRSLEEVGPFPRVEASSDLGFENRDRGKTRPLTDATEKEEITAKMQKRSDHRSNLRRKAKTVLPVVMTTKMTKRSSIPAWLS